ncbi:MAG: leucine-rich repeat protein, partial [Lachnospiraceae bacterium]|nr:leucine-rich repeat protein [Lachnospiraceae bacterium]
TTIGTYAFQNCSSMTDITVPDSVTEIGTAAFSGCGSLQSMTLPFVGAGSSQAAASTKSLFGYIFGTKSYTGGTAVKQLYSSSGVTYYIPASLKSVRITGGTLLYGSFYGCSGLTYLTLPGNLTEVGKYAFYQCSGLKEISLPASVASIGSYAFAGCSSLQEFAFPPKVSSIESYTFSGCSSMDQITIPEGITEIGAGAFQNCSSLTRMIVPESVTTMGADVFSGCSRLQSMTLPFAGYSGSASSASAKSLFGYIFGTTSYAGGVATKQYYTSSGFKTYYIPASLKNVVLTGGNQILYGTFYGCSGLNGITLPGTISGIGQKAFYQCTALTEMTIPQNVTSLAANVFAGCTGMKYVTFSGKAPETIAATAFTGVTATVFYPVSDTTWNDIIGNQYGGTLTWQPHTHSYQPVVTAPTCTEQGYTTYQCTRCNSSYTGNYVNALGHVSVIDPAVQATCTKTGLTEGSHCSVCGDVIIAQMTTQKTGHRFIDYVSNQDATYEQDGTKTAKCNQCQATETITDPGSKLTDEKKPTIEITVGTNHWTGFFHAITFGLFFKNSQTATIQAVDEEKLLDGSMVNRLDGVYYYLSDTEIKSQELEQVAWKKYTNALTLDPDKKYIVYAKAVDRSKNTTYASSAGMIVDHTAPAIDGISDGQTYCEKAVFAVKDLSLRSVTDNGVELKAADGLYTIAGDDKPHRIIAEDDCGNSTEVVIMITEHHVWKEPVFSWGDNHKSCTAEYTCSRDSSHVTQVKCTVKSQSPDATCVKAGRVIYTATAILDGVVKTDMKTVSGTVLGHDYASEFVWAADHATCTLTLTCQRAGCTEDTEGHILDSLPCMVKTRTTAATCISQGKREVVASLTVEGVEYTDACNTEVIPVDSGNHVHTQIFNQREATCLVEGATGDVYCLDCNKIVEESTATERLAHVWDDGQITKTATCSETGILLHTCTSGCGTVWEKEIPVDAEHHGALHIVGAKEPTATEAGYTGDTYCDDCKQTVVYGSVIPATGNIGGTESPLPGSTGNPSAMPGSTGNPMPNPGGTESPLPMPGNTGAPVPTPGNSGGSSTGNGSTDGKTSSSAQKTNGSASSSGSASAVLKKGTVFVAGNLQYKVTKASNGKFTVAVQAPKSKAVKSLAIPAAVKVQGQSYQVTSIAASAFQKCSKLKKITIGKNVTVIGKKAFYQAKKLKQITISSTKITSVGKNAWKGIYKKAVIQVPKKKRAAYQKLFRNKGQKKTVRIK